MGMRKEMFEIFLDEKKQSLKSKPDLELESGPRTL